MNFINNDEKIKNIFKLDKKQFFKVYNTVTEKEYIITLDILWEKLGNILIDENENILENFYIWKKGTFREEIWHFFDKRIDEGIGNRYFN